MRHTKKAMAMAWGFLGLMLTGGSAYGQVASAVPGPPVALTLEEAVARAVADAPRIAEARAREAAAASSVMARSAQGLPVLVASSSYLRTNHVDEFGIPQANGTTRIIFPDLPNNYRARAELQVPLYTAGRVTGLVAAAEADGHVAAADRETAEADIRLETARAYWTLVLARATVGVLEQALQRADATVRDVGARVDAGLLPPNDVLSAQALRARQRVRLIQATNDAAIAEADLARLIGAPGGQALRLTSDVTQPAAGADGLAREPVDALVARAHSQRAERDGLEARQTGLRAMADAAQAARRPQINAIAAVEPARPNSRFVPRVDRLNTSWDLGVSVNWALWDGGRARADAATASAQALAVRHRLDDFDALVALDIRQRVLDLASTRAALDASAEAITASTEARRVVEERFAAGVATSTDVLEAQVALLEAELERTRLSAALRLGEARLVRSVGGR